MENLKGNFITEKGNVYLNGKLLVVIDKEEVMDLKMFKLCEKVAEIETRMWYLERELKEAKKEKQEYSKFLDKTFGGKNGNKN